MEVIKPLVAEKQKLAYRKNSKLSAFFGSFGLPDILDYLKEYITRNLLEKRTQKHQGFRFMQ